MDIYTTAIAVSILIYIAIGNYAGRGVKKLDDYFVAGRRAPSILIIGTLVASVLSSTIFLGEVGFAYEGQAGPYMAWPQYATGGYIVGALFFGRYLRRSRATTVAEFFGERFNSRRVQSFAGVTIILALGGYLLAVTWGAAVLLSELTALSYHQAIIVAWISYTGFTMYSGSRGVVITDTLMFLVFTVASIAAIYYLVDLAGGMPAAIEDLAKVEGKEDLMSWHGIIGPGTEWPTAMDYLWWTLILDTAWAVLYIVGPWQSSRHLMAKNEHVVLRAACYACLFLAALQFMIYGTGGIINLSNPNIENSDTAMIWTALNVLPEVLGALMLAGIVAAVLSSASTFLSLVGFSASNDIVERKFVDDKSSIRFSRLMMLGVGFITLIAALIFPRNIFWFTMFVATVFASSWGAVALMSIWSKTITEAGAFWGMVSGFFGNVIPKLFDHLGYIDLPSYMDPILIGVVISLIVTIIVSRNTTVTPEEEAYRVKLHERPEEELDPGRLKLTLLAPAVLIINGLTMPFIMIKYYVIPFQRAHDMLMPDGSINWATGEAVVALSWAVVWIGLGLLARHTIKKHYSPAKA